MPVGRELAVICKGTRCYDGYAGGGDSGASAERHLVKFFYLYFLRRTRRRPWWPLAGSANQGAPAGTSSNAALHVEVVCTIHEGELR